MKAARIDRLPEGGYVVCDGVTGQGVFASSTFDGVVNFLYEKMNNPPVDVPITGTGGSALAASRSILSDEAKMSPAAFADKLMQGGEPGREQVVNPPQNYCPDCGVPAGQLCPKNGKCAVMG